MNKILTIGLLWLTTLVVFAAGSKGDLQYNTNTFALSPTNVMASNVYAGYGLTKLQGAGGAITLSNLWSTNGFATTGWVGDGTNWVWTNTLDLVASATSSLFLAITQEQRGPVHLNGDQYTTNGVYLSSAGLVNSNAAGSVTFNGGTQTNTSTLGVGGSATLNGGLTVTNASAASGSILKVGDSLTKFHLTNANGTMCLGIGATPQSYYSIAAGGTVQGNAMEVPSFGYLYVNTRGYVNYAAKDIFEINGFPITNGAALLIPSATNDFSTANSTTNTPIWSDGSTLYIPDQLNVLGITNNGSTTVGPLTVGTNGGVAVAVDAGGKATFNGGIVASNAGSSTALGSGTNAPSLQVFAYGKATPALIVQTNGNVGIGKQPASGYPLDVNGTVNVVGGLNATYFYATGPASYALLVYSNLPIAFHFNEDKYGGSAIGSVKLSAWRKVMQDAVSTNVLGMTINTNMFCSVWDDYTIMASDGTNVQVTSGTLTMDAMNVNGVLLFTNIDAAAHQRTLVTAGTLAPTWAVVSNAANKVVLTLSADTSLDGACTNLTSTHCIRANGAGILTLGY